MQWLLNEGHKGLVSLLHFRTFLKDHLSLWDWLRPLCSFSLYPILISLLLYRCCSQKQPPIIHLHTNLKLRVCFPGNLGKNSKMTPMIFTFWYSHLCMTLSPWVSGACDLLLTDGIWWGWWHVTPMIRLQCRYKTPSCWHALKRLPCWLWNKLPYCERDYGEGHMERNNGWPLGAESSRW